jgi:phage protein D
MAEVKDRPLIFVKLHVPGAAAPGSSTTKARKAQTLDISDRILGFRYEDEERKADRLELTLDNYDLTQFDNPAWKKGNVLEVTWGYPGNMTPSRRAVIEKISGGYELRVEAHGLEMLMHKTKSMKVYKNKTLYQIAEEVWAKYSGALEALGEADAPKKKPSDVQTDEKDFRRWYKLYADSYGLDQDPDAGHHFYDFRALYRDTVNGKYVAPNNATAEQAFPARYRKGMPGYWVRNEALGPLIDSRTNQPVAAADIDKVAAAATTAAASRASAEADDERIALAAKEVQIVHASQSAQTDAQFLAKLARQYGYHFYIDHTGFRFVPRDQVYKRKPAKAVTWFHGSGEWLDFSYENNVADKPSKVIGKGIDPATGREFTVEGSDAATKRNGLGPHIRDLSDRTGEQVMTDRTPEEYVAAQDQANGAKAKAETKGEKGLFAEITDVFAVGASDEKLAKKRVDGKYKKRQGHAHELSGKVIGDPGFLSKSILQVDGLGRRLSGKWAVKKVDHLIDRNGGYICDFRAERDGDNGYGEKGDNQSKASINKEQVKKDGQDRVSAEPIRNWDQRTGTFSIGTRNPQGTS